MWQPTKRDTNWIPENEQNTIPGRNYHHPAIVALCKKSTFSLKIHSLHTTHHKLHITHYLLHIRSSSATKNPLYTTWKTNPSQLDPIRQLTDATYLHMINNTKTSSSEAEALNSSGEVDPLYILWIANAKWLTITTYPLAAANLTSTTKTIKQGLHRHLPTIAPTIEVGLPRVLYFKKKPQLCPS